MPAPSNCQFCPTPSVYAEIFVDPTEIDLNLTQTAPQWIELPALNTVSRAVSRQSATQRAHSNSGGTQVDVCSASTVSEAFEMTGEFCLAFPIFCLLHPNEIASDDGAPIARPFKVYLDGQDRPGTPATIFWEFTATYQWGNMDFDIAGGSGTQYNVTLSVTEMTNEPDFSCGSVTFP